MSPWVQLPALPSTSLQAGNKRRGKGSKKKILEALVSFQERLVKDKGYHLASRLMLEHCSAAAAAIFPYSVLFDLEEESPTIVNCDRCEFSSYLKDVVGKHMSFNHKQEFKKES